MERRFTSKYMADGPVTAAQYLAETIVERIAKKEGVTLPVKFWNTAKWKPIFTRQVVAANHLLKKYELKDIVAALNTKKAAWIQSLGAKSFLEPIILMVSANNNSLGWKTELEEKEVVDVSGDIFFEVDNVLSANNVKPKRSLWEQLA